MRNDIVAKKSGMGLSVHAIQVFDTLCKINEAKKLRISENKLFYFAMLHDVGKANFQFYKNMMENNFDIILRHEICSLFFINVVPKRYRDEIAFTILSHHKSLYGSKRSFMEICSSSTDIKKHRGELRQHIRDISKWGVDVKNYFKKNWHKNIHIPTENECWDIVLEYFEKSKGLPNGYSEFRGLCRLADTFASAYENDGERCVNLDRLFKPFPVDNFNIKDENYPLSLIISDKSKRHTIVIAPTGSGKTNFMMKRCSGTVRYTLPFCASINLMYKRLIDRINTDEFVCGIRHSSVDTVDFLNEDTKKLTSFFGASLIVSTPIQLMSSMFRLNGFEGNILDLKGCDIILDEIHVYGEKMLAAVVELTRQLVKIGCNVHICTATIPTKVKNELLDILGRKNTQVVEFTNEQLDKYNRHIIHTVNDKLLENDIDSIIREYKNGKKVVVVSNTVKKINNKTNGIYQEIKRRCPNANILLLHSRYKRHDRNRLEERLMEIDRNNEPCILVSTQVIEVSLDINFDVMFTDCSAIDSMVQRFGRVNRKRADQTIMKPVYIYLPYTDYYQEKSKVGLCMPYNKDIVEKTFNVLSRYNGMVLPERNIQSLIDEVYSDIRIMKVDMSPYTPDGVFKEKMYCHVTNSSLSSELDIQGYFAILESEVDDYINGHIGREVEIPLNRKPEIKNGFREVKKRDEDDNIWFYAVSDSMYTNELGLVIS